MTTPKDVLELAATIIEVEGWTKGAYRDESGFCAIGALREARDRLWRVSSKMDQCQIAYVEAYQAATRRAYQAGFGTVASFNDSQDEATKVSSFLRTTEVTT